VAAAAAPCPFRRLAQLLQIDVKRSYTIADDEGFSLTASHMDAADVFRGLGSVIQRPPQYIFPKKAQVPQAQPRTLPPPQLQPRDDVSDNDAAPSRIAHTLTACCRCRQVSPLSCIFMACAGLPLTVSSPNVKHT
jgi:hypothetical protein